MNSKRVDIEYIMNCSPKILYNYVTLPSGLSTWFADRVDRVGDSINFFWGGHSEIADVINSTQNKSIRYQWERDRGSERYFEFKIEESDLAKIVSLHIVSVVEQSEEDEQVILWDNSVEKLKRVLGVK